MNENTGYFILIYVPFILKSLISQTPGGGAVFPLTEVHPQVPALLAQSKSGVTIQMYLALIAAVLLSFYTGQKPNRRQIETIQFYMLGYASAEETAWQVAYYAPRLKKNQVVTQGHAGNQHSA
jgi:hypothetical protein